METTKKTAVDWFMGKIGEKQPNGLYVIDTLHDVQNVFQQAKEMEKEQIKSAFNIGELMAHDYFYGNDECAENYYNETYKVNN